MEVWTWDVSRLNPGEVHHIIQICALALRLIREHRIPHQTAFVVAYLQPLEASPGFIEAINAYVWNNDSSRLTKALKRDCDLALEVMCKVS